MEVLDGDGEGAEGGDITLRFGAVGIWGTALGLDVGWLVFMEESLRRLYYLQLP